MIYECLTDLPGEIQSAMPRHAQEIFREAYNQNFEDHNLTHEEATQAAMSAVEEAYYLDQTCQRWKKK